MRLRGRRRRGRSGEAADDEAREWAGVAAGPWLSGVLQALRGPEALGARGSGPASRAPSGPTSRWASAGCTSCRRSASAPASPTTWASARRSRCSRCCVVLRRERRPRPGRGRTCLRRPGLAARELGGRDRPLRAGPVGPRRPPVGDARRPRRARRWTEARARRPTSSSPRIGSVRTPPLGCKASAGTWSSSTRPRRSRTPAAQQTRAVKALHARGADRPDRHAGREPARRSLVALRLPQPGPARIGAAVHGADASAWRQRPHNAYGPLRDLVRPYILRRLKTDRAVIADLPDKTEVNAYCLLSRAAGRALRAGGARSDASGWPGSEGIERRGLVLASLMRLKQICNHPSQWLGRRGAGARRTAASARGWREVARRDRGAPGEGARLHAVPRDDRAARRLPRAACSAGRAWCCTAARRSRPGASWSSAFQEDERVAVLRAVAQGRRQRV